MARKLLERLRVFIMSHREGIKTAAIGFGIGIGIGGAITANKNSDRIDEIDNDLKSLDLRFDGYEEQTECRIHELQRQNNLLLEKALRETEGTAE